MKRSLLTLLTFLAISFTAIGQNLVITEIMYNNPGGGQDSLEFVEIYNAGNSAVNLKNFTFRTAFIDTLPDVNLASKGYYVVAFNAIFFKKVFGFDPGNQWRAGALNNTGERIDLFNATGMLLDSVRYANIAPWPTAANGNGPSLVLCDVTKDNGVAANWTTSTNSIGKLANIDLFASPGKIDCQGSVNVTANKLNLITQKNLVVAFPSNTMANPASATIEITKQPANGTLTSNNNNFIYTPKVNFCGLDVVEFKACIGANCDSKGTVTINVSCPSSYPKYSIGLVTNDKDGNSAPDSLSRFVEVEGIVHSPNFATSPSVQYVIIDGTNKNDGITVFRNGRNFGYSPKEGDKIRVQGRINMLNGLTSIIPDTIFQNGTGTLFAPTLVTKLDESTENMLVEVKGLTLDNPAQWTGAGNGYSLATKDANGNAFTVRVDADIVDLFSSKGPGSSKFDCIGMGSQFTNVSPFTTGYQLMPRKLSDLKVLVGANDLALGKTIKVFPNPFVNSIGIEMKEKMDKIWISDFTGRLIAYFSQPSESQVISTNDWANGFYFITVEKDGRQFTTKLVK